MAITESGYPKKGEVIHATDVGKTFTGTTTTTSSSGNIKTVYLTRRDGTDAKEVINYCVNTLESSSTGAYSTCMTVKAARASLSSRADVWHTHHTSDFSEFQGWSIQVDSSGRLVFSA